MNKFFRMTVAAAITVIIIASTITTAFADTADYTIRFLTNCPGYSSTEVYGSIKGSQISKLGHFKAVPAQSNADYEFIGWNTEKDGSGEFLNYNEEFKVPESDVDYYGIWDAKGSFNYYNEILISKPWGITFFGALNGVEKSEYTDYSVYVVTTNDCTTPSKAEMLKGDCYKAGDKNELANDKYISFKYNQSISSTEINKNIYVMFCATSNGKTYFGNVKNRGLIAVYRELSNKEKNSTVEFSYFEKHLEVAALGFGIDIKNV